MAKRRTLRKRVWRVVRWTSPYTWPEPETDLGLAAQMIGWIAIVVLWIAFIFWVGTPRH